MNTIEERVEQLIKKLDLTVPINVEAVADFYKVEIRKSPSKDFSGILYRKDEIAFMAINSKESAVRQRFTIAHELGHFFLHKNTVTFVDYRNTPENVKKTSKEREANQFAACLLMPKFLLEKDVKTLNVQNISELEISCLSSKYNVSQEAMTYRLLNLNLSIN